jgi:hypothetical protein
LLVAEQVTWGSLLHVPSERWDYFLFAFFSFMCTALSTVFYTTDGECGSPTSLRWQISLWLMHVCDLDLRYVPDLFEPLNFQRVCQAERLCSEYFM